MALKNSRFQDPDSKYLGEKMGVNGAKTLMDACKMDDHRGVEYLIMNGANPIAQDFKGNDALYYAVIHNSNKALNTLLLLAKDVMPRDRVYGKKKRNILSKSSIYSHDISILEALLNHKTHGIKFNANMIDRFQRNAIFYSVFRNKVDAVRLFITKASNCSLDVVDMYGKCLLDYAKEFNFEEILLELVRGGAKLGNK